MNEPALATVLSPNRRWNHLILAIAGSLGLAAVLMFVFFHRTSTEILIGVVLLAGALIAVWAGFRMVVGITVYRDRVELQPVFGPARSLARNRFDRAVVVDDYLRPGVDGGGSDGTEPVPTAYLALLDRRDRALLRTPPTVFHATQLAKIARALQPLPVTHYRELMTPAMLAEDDPAAVPYWERRPMMFAVWVTLGLIVVLSIAVIAIDGGVVLDR